MEKIKLALDNDRLNAINMVWSYLKKEKFTTVEQKTMFDIVVLLAKKFKKKAVEKEFTDADFTMKLHYHECYFLVKAIDMCTSMIDWTTFPFEYNILLSTANFLRQKMA